MTHTKYQKRRSNLFFLNVLTVFSHSQMFSFITQREEVKRVRKTAIRKTSKKKKKQGSRETCQAAVFHLTLELPICCAESVELRVSLWSSRSLGSVVMEQVHEACASLRKFSNFYSKTLKRMEEAKINLTFNCFGGIIKSGFSRKYSGGKSVEIKTR